MKFGVLGAYQIFPGLPHRIHAAKHRKLLALLTVNAGHFVSVDRLAQELWPVGPPLSAPNLIRQYVSAIRRALPAEAGAGLISTMPAGYRMSLRPGDLDRHEFDRLADEGRAAFTLGLLDEAADPLAAALALWRGEPLADLEPSPSIEAEARRLTERWLATVELQVDVELERGRYDRVLDELAALVTLHPGREGLRARQMRALYATGRRAEALRAFREGREALIDSIGIEPGPQLQQVHRMILNDELTAQPAARAVRRPPGAHRPAQLPADVPDLVGRDDDVARVSRFLSADAVSPVMVISGKAGVGKSVLAVRAGHLLRDRFPDGQLFLRMDRQTPQEALRRALRALGAPAPQDQDPHETYATWMRNRRMLIVLDDAAHERDVRPLIPAGSPSVVLVTSPSVLAGLEGAQHLVCAALTDAAGVRMLAGIIGQERADAEPDAVHAVVTGVSRLPLAVRIAGSRLVVHRHRPVADLARRLSTRNPLDVLRHGDLQLRPRIAASYRRLDEQHQRVFARLAALPGPFDADTVAAAAELSADAADAAIDRLLELHLLDSADGGRYVLDRLIAAFARERLHAGTPGLNLDSHGH
ncbi:NB-ARC domain-containing protein [Dactylosporangium sp. NBC_01737]|uniref:AfsR/SARP family transcriptional regulator n=1 Tax=Dactylosporangium sp. NBC_01737 TaxID=2975959 RepID=UPI002E0F0DE8|nr:NB-ARC domain-containing protein [Dactylosporangium sp. NBC_01737]